MITTLALTALLLTDLSGSGKPKTEKRNVEAFTSIHALGSMTVEVLPADKPALEVTADDNLLAIVETSVKDKTLTIKTSKSWSNGTITVKVWAPSLDGFQRDGSGTTTIKGVASRAMSLKAMGSGTLTWNGDVEKLTVEAMGSGNTTLSGKAQALAVKVAGSGNVNAKDVAAKTGTVEIAGSGNADVNVSEALQVNLVGSGNVNYSGAPKVTKNVVGSGKIVGASAPATLKIPVKEEKPSSGW